SQGTSTKEHGLETRLAIVEQASFVVDGQIQNVSIPTAPNSFCDSKVICPDNSPKANDYDDPMPSSMKKGTNEVQTDYDSDCSTDNDKINDTMVSYDDEDAGYNYDLRT
ncbi:32603_t:CDS:2, partial [Gigaspora margarita]